MLAALAACGRREDVIVVGSKNFTEQRILGELLAQTVESLGLRAERKLDLGGTFVCDAAIRAGQIDMYVIGPQQRCGGSTMPRTGSTETG